ncbi:flagellar hook-length control protein FliK [Bosea sp. NBC_00550]|uniref:flagellar hook-length control protein FliK n=1 Tax=Bosea sp. NBC_00550 TaxID=2969621 RepID=UPI00222E3AB0|nr:flagellar hook-length control protein FliK [Bosea sp. NBC_00550]UZF94530.1 flagellar hook-length control protein FliK [Bosea sp. NBC_00550]
MNLAQLVKSQTFATLLQALDAAGELTAGRTVQAKLLSLEPDGTATAAIGDTKVALVLAGPQARQAALQPGATLLLRLDPPEQPGGDLRATLVEVRPPTSPSGAPIAQQPLTPPPATGSAAAPAAVLPAPAAAPPASSSPQPNQAPQQPSAGSAPPISVAAAQLARATAEPSAPAPATVPQGAAPAAAAIPAIPAALTAAAARLLAGPLLGAVLHRQDSLAPLFANLRGLAEGSIALALPKTLLPAIDRVLAQAVPAERQPVTAQRLKEAFQSSGLFMEAHQAAGEPPPRQGDLKASLQALRETLLPIVESLSPDSKATRLERAAIALTAEQHTEIAPGTAADQTARAAPPRRDGPLLPQPATEPTLAPGEKPLAIAETLLGQTEAALDRIKLTQYASLPLEPARQDGTQPAQRWLAEIPIAFQHGTAMLPLHVEREAPRRDVQGVSPPLWRIRFALDVEPMGPLQGVVTLQGRDVGVTLWAERDETSQILRGAAPGLESALLHADFASGAVDVHTGQPRVMQPTAGQFLDRLS